MTVAAPTRRLPGLRVERPSPVAAVELPRMDVAVLVGIAEAGPIDLPVAIEDPHDFARVFGADAPLGWDPELDEDVSAHLGPAVRAFFANGGRRCWVIRVARNASTGLVDVPGLAVRTATGLEQAALPARSPGTVGDGLRARAVLRARVVALAPVLNLPRERLVFTGGPEARSIRPGDLLRMADDRETLVLPVAQVEPSGAGAQITGDTGEGRGLSLAPGVPATTGEARYTDGEGRRRGPVPATVRVGGLDLATGPWAAPAPGAVVTVSVTAGAAQELVVMVARETRLPDTGTMTGGPIHVAGEPLRVLPPLRLGTRAHRRHAEGLAEVLTLDLLVDGAAGRRWRLDDLGLAEAHPRHVGRLPDDQALHGPAADSGDELVREASRPRFPLAGGTPALFVPLGIGILPGPSMGTRRQAAGPAARNGAGDLSPRLFLDERVLATPLGGLGPALDDLVLRAEMGGPPPRGAHAAWNIEDATLIAAPDAVHPGLDEAVPDDVAAPPGAGPADDGDDRAFTACRETVLPAPVLAPAAPDDDGRFRLEWTASAPGVTYLVEEALPGGDEWTLRFRGSARSVELRLPDRRTRRYRVRALDERESPELLSAWSAPVAVGRFTEPRTIVAGDGDLAVAVQRGLARLAAARGDMLLVGAAPRRAAADAHPDHPEILRSGDAAEGVPGLDASERRAWSHVALYHPWWRDGATGRLLPPDGLALGLVAARAATRGAWVAPAADPLVGPSALAAGLGRDALAALHDGQVNALRRDPQGFRIMSAQTLADPDDEELREIGARRLLCLLRRIALLHGPRWVFEPLGDDLRRRVERGFEAVLALLYRRGAFRGATARQAYRVDVAAEGPAAGAGGRLLCSIRVAPSLPLEFLTVRLIGSGDGRIVVEGP